MHERTTHRKLKGRIEPAFTPKALFQQEPIINAHIKGMCSNLDGVVAASGQDVINITDIVSGMLWNMVSDLAFGEPLLEGQRSEIPDSPDRLKLEDGMKLNPILLRTVREVCGELHSRLPRC